MADARISSWESVKRGDILSLEEPIAALPVPAGYWVVFEVGPAMAVVGLYMPPDCGAPYAGECFNISSEDLGAFAATAKRVNFGD